MDGYLLDANHLIPLLRDKHAHRQVVLDGLAMAPPASPAYVAACTLAELEVGCCFGPQDRLEAQAEIRKVIRVNGLMVIEFTKHTAAEYGAIKAALMRRYNREGVRRAAKSPEVWTSPVKGSTLGVDEFDLLVVSHAIERRLVLVTCDPMLRICEGLEDTDRPEFANWIIDGR